MEVRFQELGYKLISLACIRTSRRRLVLAKSLVVARQKQVFTGVEASLEMRWPEINARLFCVL